MKSPPQPIIAMAAAAIGAIVGGVVVNLLRDPLVPTTNERSMFDDVVTKIVIDDELDKELAPIRKEQADIVKNRSVWDTNTEASEHENRRFFVVGCERDRLRRMQAGMVDNTDCRKAYDAQYTRSDIRSR